MIPVNKLIPGYIYFLLALPKNARKHLAVSHQREKKSVLIHRSRFVKIQLDSSINDSFSPKTGYL